MTFIQFLLFQVVTLTILPFLVASSSGSTSSGASWQPPATDSQSMQEAKDLADQSPTIFSPTGRLHPVETIVEVAKSSTNPRANLVLAMNCQDGIVMISNVPTSPYLNTTTTNITTNSKSLFLDQEQNSIFHTLSSSLVAATAGNLVDGYVLGHLCHKCCRSLQLSAGGSDVTTSSLARHVADQLQLPTQNMVDSQLDLLASFALLVGDGELWRLDPTGQFWKCQAAVIGCHANKAEALLWKRLQEKMSGTDNVCQRIESMSTEDALALLQECLEESFATKQAVDGASNKIFWHAIIQYHHNKEGSQLSSSSLPRRMFQRGAFVPRVSIEPTAAEASS